MKLTPILNVRSWISKLHPPMPTTPRENKQLLYLLRSSFQRQLDDAHPPIQPTEPSSQLSTPLPGPAVDNTSARATTSHLQSLLQHPLLCQRTMHQKPAQTAAGMAAAMAHQALLDGEGDLVCMAKWMRIYLRTAHVIGEFSLGRKVAAWFTNSSAATKAKFLSSPETLRTAVPILYAEGLEEDVWEWLRMLYARNLDMGSNQGQESQRILDEIHLTFLMIREALRRSRLEAAVVHFIQTCVYMQSTGRMSLWARSSQPWQATIRSVMMGLLRRRHQHGLCSHTYDCFLQHRSLWSSSNAFAFELVCLYHPTLPSVKELVTVIGQGQGQVEALFDQVKAWSSRRQKIVVNSLLDGAQFLLEHNPSSIPEAKLILNLVEQHFPQFADVGSNEAPQKRIDSARQNVIPDHAMPVAIGIA